MFTLPKYIVMLILIVVPILFLIVLTSSLLPLHFFPSTPPLSSPSGLVQTPLVPIYCLRKEEEMRRKDEELKETVMTTVVLSSWTFNMTSFTCITLAKRPGCNECAFLYYSNSFNML